MGLIEIVIVLIVVGFLLYLVQAFLPIDGRIKQIISAVVIIVVVLWLLSLFLPGISDIRVGD